MEIVIIGIIVTIVVQVYFNKIRDKEIDTIKKRLFFGYSYITYTAPNGEISLLMTQEDRKYLESRITKLDSKIELLLKHLKLEYKPETDTTQKEKASLVKIDYL